MPETYTLCLLLADVCGAGGLWFDRTVLCGPLLQHGEVIKSPSAFLVGTGPFGHDACRTSRVEAALAVGWFG